jgi:hypothetical protein
MPLRLISRNGAVVQHVQNDIVLDTIHGMRILLTQDQKGDFWVKSEVATCKVDKELPTVQGIAKTLSSMRFLIFMDLYYQDTSLFWSVIH